MARTSSPPAAAVRTWSEIQFEDEEPSAAKRAQIVARMELRLEQTVAETSGARRRLQVFTALGCAAALCLGATGAWRWHRAELDKQAAANASALGRVQSVEGSVSVTRGGVAAAPVTGATTLGPGDDVVTASDGRTRVQLSDGVSLTLGEASRLSLPKPAPAADPALALAHEQIRLDDGVVQVKVPHLTDGRTFAVKTPDADVTVHGTAFTVEVGEFVGPDLPLRSGNHAPDATLTTRVRVSEGVVSVLSAGREVFVRPGMQWISPRAEPMRHAPEFAAPAPASVGPAPDASTGGSAVQKAIPSSLADQTRLLEAGMSASGKGDYRSAIASFNELLHRYPSSRLEPEARVQLFRALQGAHDYAGAAREARRYLAEYPDGYAREEAKKLALDH